MTDEGTMCRACNSESHSFLMALNLELPSDGSLPEWIDLLPAGPTVTGRDGRSWLHDDPNGVLSAFRAEGKDIVIDWEHASELKAPQGDPAPAAAWMKDMVIRPDGVIRVRTEWTPRGAESVQNREYRYISPVFQFERETMRIRRVTSAGLTNQPNFVLQALNRMEKEDTTMDLAKLLALLGLPATATFDEAMNRVGQLKTDLLTALNHSQNPPLDKFVPRADFDQAVSRASAAETKLKERDLADLDKAIQTEIDAALAAGKITPATVEYHKAQCRQERGLERFKEYVKVAVPVAGDTNLDNKKPGDADTALNAAQENINEMMGITTETWKKHGPAAA